MPTSEAEQIELLNREHREISQRLVSKIYKDENEKHLLEEILEENLWSLKVLATSNDIKLEVNLYDIIKEMIDNSIEDAFLYCIMEKNPIAQSAKIMKDLLLPDLTGERKHIGNIIENLSSHKCPCPLNFCKSKTDSRGCRKGIISLLAKAIPYEKYVWLRYRQGSQEFHFKFRNSFFWLMGYPMPENETSKEKRGMDGLKVEPCFEFLQRDLSNIRRAFNKIVKISTPQAIDFFQKFLAMPTKKPILELEMAE